MNSKDKPQRMDAETEAYLARIQRTVSESKALLSQIELRMAETDRMLEAHGMTRAQVEAMTFTDEQKAAVNAELKRRGMAPLEFDDNSVSSEIESASDRNATKTPHSGDLSDQHFDSADSKEDLENRRRKFNVMMNGIKL